MLPDIFKAPINSYGFLFRRRRIMKNFCTLVIICMVLLTPALASAYIASASGNGYVDIQINNCPTTQADTHWATVASTSDESLAVTVSDSHGKEYGQADPPTHTSYVSLASNPMAPNPISATSDTENSFPGTPSGLFMYAESTTDAYMSYQYGPLPISATALANSELQFKPTNTGAVSVTVSYSYVLDMLNAWDSTVLGYPGDAGGQVMLRVGMFRYLNGSVTGSNMLSSGNGGWIGSGGGLLQRGYSAGEGDSMSGNSPGTIWNNVNLSNANTYVLYLEANVLTSTYAPEPTTICLLGLGALGLLKKRRA